MAKISSNINANTQFNLLPTFLQFHKSTIESETNSFKEYIIDTRHSIKKQQDNFDLMIEEEKKKYPDSIEDLYEAFEVQYYHYHEFYPATFNNSTLLSLYSLFEFNLKNICHTLQNYADYKIKLDDLSGQNYIEKSKKYLKLVVGLDLTDLDTSWQEITKFQQIRNCIVHNNSNIRKHKDQPINKQPLYQTIKNNSYFKLNEDIGTFIIADDQFLLNVSDVIEKYLIKVIKKLQTVNQQGGNKNSI